jgi:hypothetical protein
MPELLIDYIDETSVLRTMDFEINGQAPGTYVCWDDIEVLKVEGNKDCERRGLFRRGKNRFEELKAHIATNY